MGIDAARRAVSPLHHRTQRQSHDLMKKQSVAGPRAEHGATGWRLSTQYRSLAASIHDPETRPHRHPGEGRPEPHRAARAALGPGLRRDDERWQNPTQSRSQQPRCRSPESRQGAPPLGTSLWLAKTRAIFQSARWPEPLGAAGQVELAAQRAFVGAQSQGSTQRRRVRLFAGGIATLALADAGAGLHQHRPTDGGTAAKRRKPALK